MILKLAVRLKIFFPIFFPNTYGFWEVFLFKRMGKVNSLYSLPWREKNKGLIGEVILGKEKDLLKWPTLEWCIIFLRFFQGRKTKMFPHCFLRVWICTHPGTWPCLETASGEVLDWWTTSHPFSTAQSSLQNFKRSPLGRKQNGAPHCGVSKALFSLTLETH